MSIEKVANNRYELKRWVIKGWLRGDIPYEEIQNYWSKKF